MKNLIEWLRGELGEDERVLRAVPVAPGCVPPAHWSLSTHGPDQGTVVMGTGPDFALPTPAHAEYAARFDPATLLADIEAKRRLLNEFEAAFDLPPGADIASDLAAPDQLAKALISRTHLLILASAYRRRRGWKSEWEV